MRTTCTILALLATAGSGCRLVAIRDPEVSREKERKNQISWLIENLAVQEGIYLLRNLKRLIDFKKEAVPPLIEALESPHARVRIGAAYALGYIGDRRAIEPLLKRLSDQVLLVRMEAAAALCQHFHRYEGVGLLLEHGLRHERAYKRHAAHRTLKVTFKQDFGFDHIDPPAKREAAVRRWVEFWERNRTRYLRS